MHVQPTHVLRTPVQPRTIRVQPTRVPLTHVQRRIPVLPRRTHVLLTLARPIHVPPNPAHQKPNGSQVMATEEAALRRLLGCLI